MRPNTMIRYLSLSLSLYIYYIYIHIYGIYQLKLTFDPYDTHLSVDFSINGLSTCG